MKRKIFTLLLCGLMGTMVMAQEVRTGGIKKTATAPEVDGVIDDVWATANTYPVDLPFRTETPTLGEPGQTTWKALWTDDGVFILVTVTDDEFYPGYKNNDAGTDWKYDKPEIYFDVNAEKKDGIGGGGGKGHYQFAPGFGDGSKNDGTVTTGTDGVMYAFKVTEPNYVGEYFIPFTKLLDAAGNDMDKFAPIGFDVTVIDGDSNAPAVRQRAVWSNTGTGPGNNESYGNMDDCALVTLDPIPLEGNVIKKAASTPVVDGVVDAIWSTSNVFNIDKPFQAETPTLGDAGTTTWKALWNDDGMYILLQVNDDVWYPSYASGGNSWEYDKPEIYFDVNSEKIDGGGASGGKGHYQVAPAAELAKIDGTPTAETDGMTYAFKVTDPTYVAEYFIPWTKLVDQAGLDFDKSTPMGFDVTIIDRDAAAPGRMRANWSNDGAINESWNSMDGCATIVFEGTQEAVYVDAVTVAGGSITADNGTLQMTYTVAPANASNKKVKWSVENGTGQAKISVDGLLTALTDGTVTVKAAAKDGGYAEGTAVVTISGQQISLDDVWNSFNLIKNWNFDTDLTGWGGWVDGGVADQLPPVIEDGVCVMKVGLSGDNWHYQHNQNALTAEPNVPYILKFKTWASADNTPCAVDFEDTSGNSYTRYGATTDAQSGDGRSEWHYPASIEPTWYTFHVVFDKILSNTDQKIQWMNSLSNETIYLDSVLLIKEADMPTFAQVISANTMKVYPNPMNNTNLLTVQLTTLNAKVSIFNALGQKLIEKTANGNIAKFDVSSLRKGMYFVRLDNGTTQKFVR